MSAESPRAEVLVIDDEVQIRRLLRVTLEAAGYAVREAENGQLGLNEAAFRRPDAIILDLGLPDLPGVEVLKRLREWSQVPVLILSVRGAEADKIAALDGGAAFSVRSLEVRRSTFLRCRADAGHGGGAEIYYPARRKERFRTVFRPGAYPGF